MNWILCQLKQPSTWKGVFIVAGAIGYGIKPELQEQIIIAVTAIIGIIEIYRNEHAPQPINVVLQPIDLVSTHLSEKAPHSVADRRPSTERVRESMPPDDGPESSGWNG